MHEGYEGYTGRYTRAFLNSVFGENSYTVRTFKMSTLKTKSGMREALEALSDDKISFAYMSDVKLTCVWLRDYPGWLKFCQHTGIDIRPTPKIAKRLTVMTRTAYLHTKFDNPSDLKICEVSPGEFTDYDGVPEHIAARFLDGANVISRELIEVMMTEGSKIVDKQFMEHGLGNPHDKLRFNTEIDRAGSVSLRVTTPEGLIKGDALISTREKMGGYDVLYCSENIKRELKTKDFCFVLAEPHPGKRMHAFSGGEPSLAPVWSDDQSLSWLDQWLFPDEQLKDSFKDFADKLNNDLIEGNYPSFFTQVSKIDDPYSSITQFQGQALTWERHGPDSRGRDNLDPSKSYNLGSSIFLQERIAQGAVNMLSKKARWPVPCAVYVHVASDSWLHMAGFSGTEDHPWPFEKACTPRGKAWIHEESGRLVYNDLDFADLYDRHGGWDLDDSVKVHFRTIKGQKKLVIVRSPNSWGEYDIKDYVDGTFHAPWYPYDGDPIEFPAVNDSAPQPEFIENLGIQYQYDDLSPATLGVQNTPDSLHGDTYTKDMVKAAVKTAVKFDGVFGQRANADMAYFYIMKGYRKSQLAPIEAIVDACTQEQSTLALTLINAEIKDIIKEIKDSGVVADITIWKQRLKHLDPGVKYDSLGWTARADSHSDMCVIYKNRLFQTAQKTVENVDDDIMALGKRFVGNGKVFVDWYYQLMRYLPRQDEDETQSEFCFRVNRIMSEQLALMPRMHVYNLLFGVAHYVYTTVRGDSYKDTPLFQLGVPGELSVFQLYIDAIAHFGIGDDTWVADRKCDKCERISYFVDRLQYQSSYIEANWCSSC